jgi:hypothetical protein
MRPRMHLIADMDGKPQASGLMLHPMRGCVPERCVRFSAGLGCGQADILQHMRIKIAQALTLAVQGKSGEDAAQKAGAGAASRADGAGGEHRKSPAFVMLN